MGEWGEVFKKGRKKRIRQAAGGGKGYAGLQPPALRCKEGGKEAGGGLVPVVLSADEREDLGKQVQRWNAMLEAAEAFKKLEGAWPLLGALPIWIKTLVRLRPSLGSRRSVVRRPKRRMQAWPRTNTAVPMPPRQSAQRPGCRKRRMNFKRACRFSG